MRFLGKILLARGERAEGLEHLHSALALFERKGILVLLGRMLRRIAEVEAG
jgi:hypothetical protein